MHSVTLGQVTVQTEIPPVTLPTALPGASPVSLPTTGLEVLAFLGIASTLLALGYWLLQLSRRRGAVAAVTVITLATLALPSGAQSQGVTVQASQLSGTRQFYVEDLLGRPLEKMTLPPDDALQAFRVRVVDLDFLSRNDFIVDVRLNNLYLTTGAGAHDYTAKISSSLIRLGFLPNAVGGLLGALKVQPVYLLSGLIGSCSDVTSAVNALFGSGTPLDVTQSLTQLCLVLGLSSGAISSLPVDGVLATITPTVSGVASLPIQLAGQDPGAFTAADYANGIGGGDPSPAAVPPTVRGVLRGTPLANLPETLLSDLEAQLTALVGSLPSFSVGGVDSKAATEEAVQALMSSADPVVASYGSLLQTIGGAGATQLLNTLTSAVMALQPLAGVVALAGTYFGFPGLALNATGATPGTFEGTMTVTFTQL